MKYRIFIQPKHMKISSMVTKVKLQKIYKLEIKDFIIKSPFLIVTLVSTCHSLINVCSKMNYK